VALLLGELLKGLVGRLSPDITATKIDVAWMRDARTLVFPYFGLGQLNSSAYSLQWNHNLLAPCVGGKK